MRLLDRYLFRELLAPLAICLIGIQAFVIVFNVFSDAQKIQEHQLHFADAILYAVASSADFIWVILPISLLLALLITLTTYARHNEITAMRAAGISLWRICAPYFIVGLAASAALFAMNELLVPRSTVWASGILQRYVRDPDEAATRNGQGGLYINTRAHRTWYYNEYRPRTTEMISPKVDWYLPDGSYPYQKLMADQAAYSNGVWTFLNATQNYQASAKDPEIRILVTNMLAMPEFKETPKAIERDLRFGKYDKMDTRKFNNLNIPLGELLRYLQAHPSDLPPAQARKWWTKFDGRVATPCTCLVVVLIAIPFGAAAGRRNLFFGVAGSIFICFGFFVVQQVSLAFGAAANGHFPPWLAAWLPNLIFGSVGLFLTARVR